MAKVSNAAVVTTGTLTADVDCEGVQDLSVLGIVGITATAAADVSIAVQPYTNDATPVLAPINLVPKVTASTNTLVANKAYAFASFFVGGLRSVRITLTNNNAGTLPAELHYDVETV